MTWDADRGGLVLQMADGKGVTVSRPAVGARGDRLFVPAARVEYLVEEPEAAPALPLPGEAKKAK
jgi:hypothetical protein